MKFPKYRIYRTYGDQKIVKIEADLVGWVEVQKPTNYHDLKITEKVKQLFSHLNQPDTEFFVPDLLLISLFLPFLMLLKK